MRKIVDAYHQPCNIILILQGDQAYWFKWQQSVLIDSFVEPIFSESEVERSRCPWIDDDPQGVGFDLNDESELAVELILDTALDELDRVSIESHPSQLVQRVQRNTLIRKLRADFPSASVQPLPDYLEPDSASILHHVIHDDWDKWLQLLQAQAVAITHVVTGTELLCRWSGQSSALRLLVQDLGSGMRHLLLDGSTAIYMRVVQKEDDCSDARMNEWNIQSIRQTLDYLMENVLPADKLPSVTTIAHTGLDPSCEFSATRVLGALYLGDKAELIEESTDSGEFQKNNTKNLASGYALEGTANIGMSLIHHLASQWSGWLAKKLGRRLGSQLGRQRWRLTTRARLAKQTLLLSLHKNRQRIRIIRLKRATILCAAMATVTSAVASVHGFTSSRERERLSSEQVQLHDQLGSLSTSVSALHLAPSYVVHSLMRIKNHQAVKPLNPDIVLTTVAEAITHFPEVTLNGLSWTITDDNHLLDETFTSAAGVLVRDTIWREDAPRTQVQLEISGTVDGAGGLRNKQDTIDSFVAHLKSMSGIRLVTVLESPVEAVRSSADLLGSVSNYRVSILLGAL